MLLAKRAVSVFAIASMMVSANCASIAHGTTQKIPVYAGPTDVDVALKCLEGTVTTPRALEGTFLHVVEIRRSKTSCAIVVSRAGYRTQVFQLFRNMSGWFLGNILIGGVIGFIVDAADGAMFVQSPSTIRVELVRDSAQAVSSPPSSSGVQLYPARTPVPDGCRLLGYISQTYGERTPAEFARVSGESEFESLLRYKTAVLGGNRAIAAGREPQKGISEGETRVIGAAYRCN